MCYNLVMKFKVKPGFSLLEIMVVLGFFGLIAIIGGSYIQNGLKFSRLYFAHEEKERNLQKSLDLMIKELRQAESIASFGSQSLGFYSDYGWDKSVKIKYFLEENILKKQINSDQPIELASILNQESPLFYFYNSANQETVNLDEIKLIKISFKLDKEGLDAQVKLRNL